MVIMNYGNKLSFLIVFFSDDAVTDLVLFSHALFIHQSTACSGYIIMDLIYLNFVLHLQIVLPFSYDFYPFSLNGCHDNVALSICSIGITCGNDAAS